MVSSTAGSPATSSAATPATGNSAAAGLYGRSKLGKDDFLRLLVAQMKAQDPLNPTQGTEMATQLAQFSSVEQLTNLNEKFDAQTAAQGATQGTLEAQAALNMIGRVVTAQTNRVPLGGADGVQTLTFDSPTAGPATMQILDSTGHVAATRAVTLKGGRQTFDVDSDLAKLPTADYTVRVTMQNDVKTPVPVYVNFVAKAVEMTKDGSMLTNGRLRVPVLNVLQVQMAPEPAPASTTTSSSGSASRNASEAGGLAAMVIPRVLSALTL